jgi:hypothetical protein
MRSISRLAVVLALCSPSLGLAQVPDSGTLGPRTFSTAPGSLNAGTSGGSTMPAGEAKGLGAKGPSAIPEQQAAATLKDYCKGNVQGLQLDASAVWHGQCAGAGRSQSVSLGPDGVVRPQ